MGSAYIDPPTFDLQRSFMGSTSSTPLIFVLSSGADPLELLIKFAEEKGNDFLYYKEMILYHR